MQLQPNKLLQGDKYRIEATLGQGGFGITYLAVQNITLEGGLGKIATRVKVTIKEFYMKDLCNRDHDTSYVSVPSVGSQELVAKFKRKFIKEAQNISRLDHDNIIKVLDVFEENGTAYYVMEYIDGGSLGERIATYGAMSEKDALQYVRQIASALQYIHSQKIAHLDVKPDNILLKNGAIAVLIDFGLAKQYDASGDQTSSLLAAASRGYAPLEQYVDDGVVRFSPTTDIYSLGATLFKLVTGDTPPHATNVNNYGLPALPDTLSPAAKCAITTAMQPRIVDRPQDIGAFLALIDGSAEADDTVVVGAEEETLVVESEPVVVPLPTPAPAFTPTTKPVERAVVTPTSSPKKKRNFTGVIIAAVVALVVIGGSMLFLGKDDAKETAQLPKKVFTNEDYVNMGSPAECSIPYGYTEIGEEAFYKCDSLASVTIPNSVTNIGDRAFQNCVALSSISIPNSVTSIGYQTFAVCNALTFISIPNSVTTIGDKAFAWCKNLSYISIPSSVTSIGGGVFGYCNKLAPGNVHIDNNNFTLENGILYNSAKTKVIAALSASVKGHVSIPNSVTTIGDYTFMNCYDLTSISIPNSVTSIGDEAFLVCYDLTSISIPSSVTSIGDGALSNCNKLTSDAVYINNNNFVLENSILYNSDKTRIISVLSASASGHISIPNSVTSIGNSAFNHCGAITSISIPNSVTSIGDNVFSYCYDLSSISIPDSVTSIGDFAFFNCRALTSISIPDSINSIGESAFDYCKTLTAIYVSQSSPMYSQLKEEYGDKVKDKTEQEAIAQAEQEAKKRSQQAAKKVFTNKDYKNIGSPANCSIPYGYTSIGEKAFCDCNNLVSVTIPNSVTSIGEMAFERCDALTSINIPNSVTTIENSAFDNCDALTSISIPNSVKSIGYFAFNSCNALTSISIPNSVTTIKYNTFSNCGALTSISIPNSVTSIGENAFFGCDALTSISIPNSVTSIGGGVFNGCNKLTPSGVHINSNNFVLNNGILYNSAKTQVIAALSASLNGHISIPNSVTSIGNSAFLYCEGLTSISIPNSVTSIGNSAFLYCEGLTSISIPNSVTSIGQYAFAGCSALTSISIPNSVTYIGNRVFINCDALKYIYVSQSNPIYSKLKEEYGDIVKDN